MSFSAQPIKMDDAYLESNIVYSSNGDATWIPSTHVKAYCSMNMTYWPHDKHICRLKFGSWTYSGEDLQVQHANYDVNTATFLWLM